MGGKRHAKDRIRRSYLVHQIAHGLAGLQNTIEEAGEIIDQPFIDLSPETYGDLQNLIGVIRREVRSQVFSATSYLSGIGAAGVFGTQKPEIVSASPALVLSNMLPDYAFLASRRFIALEVDHEQCHSGCPEIDLEINLVRRVFHNALSNALKYSYDGTEAEKRKILVWWKRHDAAGSQWAVRIQNFGVGIRRDEMAKVFLPQYRGQLARKESILGAGLGLTDVKRCIGLHGGNVHIGSVEVPGDRYVTTLTLVFPVHTTIRRRLQEQ